MAPQGCHIVASECDRQLLESGMFSDVKVECQGKTWHLHRAILLSRCPYFKKAAILNDVIWIDGQSPEDIDNVIHFIYTGKLPKKALDALLLDSKSTLNSCLDLFILADFFDLEGLKKRAIDALIHQLLDHACDMQVALRVKCDGSVTDYLDLFMPQYFDAVRRVYAKPLRYYGYRVKDLLLRYMNLTRYIILGENPHGDKLRTDPSLAGFLADILEGKLFRPFDMETDEMPKLCSTCKKEGVFTEFVDEIDGEERKAYCRKCKPMGDEEVISLLRYEGYKGWRPKYIWEK